MRVVVNASPLIALDRVGRLEVLHQLFGSVVRPQSVYDEVMAGTPRYPVSSDLQSAKWILTEPDPPETVFRKELGAGETAVIALAIKTHADLVILDDLQARLVAAGLGLTITGTLGVLVAAHRAGFISDLEAVIRDLDRSGFRIPSTFTERFTS